VPHPSLGGSARLHPVSNCLDFEIIFFFFTEQGRQPCVQPPTWRTWSLYLCPSVTGWSSYTPRHRFRFLSLLRVAELRWRYSKLPPHREDWNIIWHISNHGNPTWLTEPPEKKSAPPKITNLIQLFYSLEVKENSYGPLYHVLMDPPLRAGRGVTRLPLAPSPACSRTYV
jgi:hypothetical protein